MASDYSITFIYGFMDPDGGVSFSLNAETDRQLILTKGRCFERANSDTTAVLAKGGKPKPKHLADRAYLHYIIDCWLDDKPLELGPSELD